MYKLKTYQEIFDISKKERKFTINISELSNKDSLRVIDFITGLTIYNGKIEKVAAYTFKCSYK